MVVHVVGGLHDHRTTHTSGLRGREDMQSGARGGGSGWVGGWVGWGSCHQALPKAESASGW